LFIEHAPAAIALFDRDMRYLATSQRWRTDYHLNGESLVGRFHYEVFPEIPEQWKVVHRRAMSGEVVRSDEDRFDRADGTTQWLRWEIRPWYTCTNEIGGVTLCTEDITSLKLVEETLRHERDLNEAIINTAQMIILLLDPNGRILHFNPYLERLSGWTLAEVQGRDWFDTFLPERDRERIREVFRQAVGGKPTRANVNAIMTRTGEERSIEWYDTRLPDDGHLVGLLALGLDVTDRIRAGEELQEREARLRAVFDATVDAILTIDERGIIQSINRSTERMFGYSAVELLGRNVSILMPEPYATEHDSYLERYLRTGEKRIIGIGREVVGRRKDGDTFPIELAVAESGGPTRRFIGFIRDITERKELEARFLRAQRLESVGTLVSGIAHDLNNVLTPVLMAVKLLKNDKPGLDKADLLDTAQRSIERGAGMIRQLLTFCGGAGGERILVHLEPLMTEVTSLLEHTLAKTIAVRRECSEGSATVVGDPTQLAQVLMNLCVNARDAMPEGGTLTLSLGTATLDARSVAQYPGAKPGKYLVLSVEDTGTGIPQPIQEKMFDPFFTTKPPGQGTGLGLSTVLGIVKSHGGFVNVYSEVDHGTKMSVYLPAAHTMPLSDVNVTSGQVRGHGEWILVVDDEAAIRATTKTTLESHGYRVLTADGGDAVALFHERQSEIRLVLVDMMMPVVNGPTVMRAIRRLSPQIPILAASGLQPTGPTADVIQAVGADFISKPFSDDELLAKIGESLVRW
jgi:PAS domain S-box-containing protein